MTAETCGVCDRVDRASVPVACAACLGCTKHCECSDVGSVVALRDAPVPAHVCADERDDTGHCRRCGERVVSTFERHGRAVKVRKMLAVVDQAIAMMPAGTTDEEAALRFARFRREDRARLCMLAAVRPPSDDTWIAFLEAVRTRKAVAAMEDEPTDVDGVIS